MPKRKVTPVKDKPAIQNDNSAPPQSNTPTGEPDNGAAAGSPPTPPPPVIPEAKEEKPSTPQPETPAQQEPPMPSPADMAAMMEAEISKRVVETINKMELGKQIQVGIDKAVKAQLEPILAQAKALTETSNPPTLNEAVTGGVPATDAPTGKNGGILEVILPFLLKQFTPGQASGGGMAQMAEMFKGMQSFQEMAYSFYSAPRDQAMKEMTGMLKLALQAGADPKDLPGALEKSFKQN